MKKEIKIAILGKYMKVLSVVGEHFEKCNALKESYEKGGVKKNDVLDALDEFEYDFDKVSEELLDVLYRELLNDESFAEEVRDLYAKVQDLFNKYTDYIERFLDR
jgi:predicted nuclease with TOPRIM domain